MQPNLKLNNVGSKVPPLCGTAIAVHLVVSILVASQASASDISYAHFSQVPDVYTSNPVQWAQRLNAGQHQTVRVALFGDSQETALASGNVYMPRMNFEAYQRFGNMPESPFASTGFYWTGTPHGDWMVSGAGTTSDPWGSPTRMDSASILPGVRPAAFYRADRSYGQVIMLTHDGSNIAPGANIPAHNYFDPRTTIQAEIFAHTNVSSGEISYRVMSSDTVGPSLFSPVTQQGTLDLDLESNVSAIKSGLIPPMQYGGRKYLSLQVGGTSNEKPTDFVGMRFRNTSDPRGMVFSSFSVGGYSLESHLANHANAGELFAAMDFQVAAIHLGANDVNAGYSAAEFHERALALIDRLRDWADDTSFPVVLFTDPDRTLSLESNREQFDRYAGAMYQIARDDPNVLLVNSRRITDTWGWQVGHPAFSVFVADGAHYTSEGARRLAALEFEMLMRVSGSVPEPASLALPLLGSSILARRRR